jgi:DNA-directed RNA polymerase specialized sigma24 family protein
MGVEKHDAKSNVSIRSDTFAPALKFSVRPGRSTRTAAQLENWRRRSEKWADLMVAAQRGENHAYAQLLKELDVWLGRYYARRLPRHAAEDARQEVLLAIHVKRHTYVPSRSFGAWVAAIARYKWIDFVRDASRCATLSFHGQIMPIDDRWDDLLRWLPPAQACVIRLVKLEGLSIEAAARATGQSAALVKVNIHRGLKKLASRATFDVTTHSRAANFSQPPGQHSQPKPPVLSTL